MSYFERISAIFKEYAPHKLNSVEHYMVKYEDRMDALMEALVRKYGPEPLPHDEGCGSAARPNEEVVTEVGASPSPLTNHVLTGSTCTHTAPVSTVSTAPTSTTILSPPTSYHSRVLQLYTLYAPLKLPTVDGTMERYRGREEELILALVYKYGPECPPHTSPHDDTNQTDNDHHVPSSPSSALQLCPLLDYHHSQQQQLR